MNWTNVWKIHNRDKESSQFGVLAIPYLPSEAAHKCVLEKSWEKVGIQVEEIWNENPQVMDLEWNKILERWDDLDRSGIMIHLIKYEL